MMKKIACSVCLLILLWGCQPRVVLHHPIQSQIQGDQASLATLLHQYMAKTPAAGDRHPTVASIPLSRRVPASRLRFSIDWVNAALLITSGSKRLTKPVTFGAFLTNPAVWDHSQLNNIVYQLGRGFYSKNAYEFFGLVKARGKTYLGVRWYSPADSGQHLAAGIVLLLKVKGRKLDLILLRRMDYWSNSAEVYRGSSIPVLNGSPAGDLLLMDWDGTWKLLPNGEWKKIGMAQKQP